MAMLSPVATKKFAELYETDGQKNVLDKETDQLLVPILKEIKYGIRENIMDHGCGTGRVGMKYFVPAAEKTDSKIYGIDRSESMISHAKEYYSHPRVTYYRTHLLSPEFPLNDVRFNKIFSIHVLIADPEWRATLKKMYELLKPRGILTAMLVVQSTDYFAAQKHLVEHPKWNKHSLASGIHIPDWIKDGSDPEDLFRQELTFFGFNILSIDTNARTHTFPTKAECIELSWRVIPMRMKKIWKRQSIVMRSTKSCTTSCISKKVIEVIVATVVPKNTPYCTRHLCFRLISLNPQLSLLVTGTEVEIVMQTGMIIVPIEIGAPREMSNPVEIET